MSSTNVTWLSFFRCFSSARQLALRIEWPSRGRSAGHAGIPGSQSPQRGDEDAIRPARSRDAVTYLDHMQRIARLPTHDLTEFKRSIVEEEEKLQKLLSAGWVQRLAAIFTGLLAPAVGSVGNAFIRQSAQHRIACLAIGVRLYEKREGKLPTALSDLAKVGVDFNEYMPPAEQPFGYALEEQGAVLWGADFQSEHTIPSQPPTTDPGEPQAWVAALWSWRFAKQPASAPTE